MVTLSGNDSKQIAAATSFRMSALFSEGQKNLVNSENKENLSNYQPLKREPSVCSTSLLFSKFITVVQFFFRVTPVLQWFQLNFGAGNFRGRRPGTSALRMLLRLTAVNLVPRGRDPFGQKTGIATSGQVQFRKSAIHRLPVNLHMPRVKSDKSDWFCSQSIVFT